VKKGEEHLLGNKAPAPTTAYKKNINSYHVKTHVPNETFHPKNTFSGEGNEEKRSLEKVRGENPRTSRKTGKKIFTKIVRHQRKA